MSVVTSSPAIWCLPSVAVSISATSNGSDLPPDVPGSETNSLKAIYTATGRIGYLWTPALLGYVKGGMAWVTNRNSVFLPSGALFESSGSFTMPGMDVGLGLEWMFAPNWSVFAEWN